MQTPDWTERLTAIRLLLQQDPEVLAATVVGSIAHGDADRWSDIDLIVYVDPDRLESLWESRRALLDRLGPILFITDINHIVPHSTIAFCRTGERLHTTYKAVQEFAASAPGQLLLLDRRTTPGSLEHASRLEDEYRPQAFAFWFHRAWVGANRSDELQQLESFIRMLEIHLATLAFARGKRFFGLRKVDRYVTGAETAWLHNCSKLLGDGRVTSAVIAVGEQYILGDNPPITDSADEVAAMIYTQDLVVRWRQTLAET